MFNIFSFFGRKDNLETQIKIYAEWKGARFPVRADAEQEMLYRFLEHTNKTSVFDLEEKDIKDFCDSVFLSTSSRYQEQEADKTLRQFLLFFHHKIKAEGYPHRTFDKLSASNIIQEVKSKIDEKTKKIFAEFGRLGGIKTAKKYGRGHFVKMASKRWGANKKVFHSKTLALKTR